MSKYTHKLTIPNGQVKFYPSYEEALTHLGLMLIGDITDKDTDDEAKIIVVDTSRHSYGDTRKTLEGIFQLPKPQGFKETISKWWNPWAWTKDKLWEEYNVLYLKTPALNATQDHLGKGIVKAAVVETDLPLFYLRDVATTPKKENYLDTISARVLQDASKEYA